MNKEETIQETITRFINKGVYQTKIIPTELPSVVIWSKTRKCLVGGKDQPPTLEVVDDGNGNLKATYDNNISISLQNRTELTESDVKEINESEGIVVTNATYGKPYFRFGFIPNKQHLNIITKKHIIMSKIPIKLTKEEWSSANTWITSASRETFERVSKEWFTELLDIVNPFYMSLYFSDDYSAMKIPYDSEHTLELERKYLKYLVYSVGRIAYDFDVKTPTAQEALNIVNKLEEQGGENWKKNRW